MSRGLLSGGPVGASQVLMSYEYYRLLGDCLMGGGVRGWHWVGEKPEKLHLRWGMA